MCTELFLALIAVSSPSCNGIYAASTSSSSSILSDTEGLNTDKELPTIKKESFKKGVYY